MRNPMAEAELTRWKLKWEYQPAVRLKNIAMDDTAMRMQVRLSEALNDDLVIQYGLAMEDGAEFPAVILGVPDRKGQHPVIDGFHRLSARLLLARRVENTAVATEAYIVDTTDHVVLEVLRRTLNNALNGLRYTMEESIQQAIRLTKIGYTIKDASRRLQVPRNRLENRLKYEEEAKPRGHRMGVSLDGLTQTAVIEINKIKRDKHFAAATELSRQARLPHAQIHALQVEVGQAMDDLAADAVLARWQDRYKSDMERGSCGLRPPSSPYRRLDMYFKQIHNVAKKGPQALENLTPSDLAALARELRKTIKVCEEMLALVERTRAKRRAS